MWELDYKESWVLKNWWFWTVVLEKTLKSPLDCKEIQPVHPKGIQSWMFIGRTDVEAETPLLWLLDVKNWCFWEVIQPVHPKGNQSWIFIGRTDAEAQTPILWPPDAKNWLICKWLWYWERLKAGGEEEDRGWDGWRAPPTRWTWVWVNSGTWQWTGRPHMLWSMGSQRFGHNWANCTELN